MAGLWALLSLFPRLTPRSHPSRAFGELWLMNLSWSLQMGDFERTPIYSNPQFPRGIILGKFFLSYSHSFQIREHFVHREKFYILVPFNDLWRHHFGTLFALHAWPGSDQALNALLYSPVSCTREHSIKGKVVMFHTFSKLPTKILLSFLKRTDLSSMKELPPCIYSWRTLKRRNGQLLLLLQISK